MIAIVLFFLDFVAFSIFNQWLVCFLLSYFVVTLFTLKHHKSVLFGVEMQGLLFLILLQDYFLNGRFGLALVYLLPIMFLARKIYSFFLGAKLGLTIVFLSSILLIDSLIINKLFFMKNVTFVVTIEKIFINIIVGCLILWGRRGNCSFPGFSRKERKVWTPNRIDAS